MQCVILAGGLGTRVSSIAGSLPKSLLVIEGRPFIDYQLENLARQGITHVVLCVGYKADPIRDFVQGGERWGLEVSYVDEGHVLRGTAGALRLAHDEGVLQHSFLALYGDSFLPFDYSALMNRLRERKYPVVMAVHKNLGRWDKCNVLFEEGRVTRYDKHHPDPEMLFIDYGVSAFLKEVVTREVPPTGKHDLSDVFHRLSLAGQLGGLEASSRFYEVGSSQGIEDFREYILKHSASLKL